MVLFNIVTGEPDAKIPPPLRPVLSNAVLPEIVLFATVSVEVSERMPPPSLAELPTITLFVMVSVLRSEKTPPPDGLVPPLIVVLFRVRFPPLTVKIRKSVALLRLMV